MHSLLWTSAITGYHTHRRAVGYRTPDGGSVGRGMNFEHMTGHTASTGLMGREEARVLAGRQFMCFTSSGTRSGEFEGGEGDCRRRRWTPSTLRRYGSRCNNRNLGNATYWFRCSLRGIQSPRAAPTHNHAVGKDANTSLASCPAHASRSYHGHTHQLVDCEANCSTPVYMGHILYRLGFQGFEATYLMLVTLSTP